MRVRNLPADAGDPAADGEAARCLQALLPRLAGFGITRIDDITGLDRVGLPVAAAYRPVARSAVVSYGAGNDIATARLAAAMEAIERFHAERIDLPTRSATLLEMLPPYPPPDELRRDALRPCSWVEGRNLLTGRAVWLPLDFLHLDRAVPSLASSTGLAAGFSATEAQHHALCEIVERDAAANWFAMAPAAQATTRLDLQSIRDAAAVALLERISAAGLIAAVWDASGDLGIPVLLCCVVEGGAGPPSPAAAAWGMAAHPDRNAALLKCLREAVQSRLAAIAAVAGENAAAGLAEIEDAAVRNRIDEVRNGVERRSFDALRARPDQGADGEIAWLLERFRHAGFVHVLHVDLTRPDVGIPVVRIVVPGMGDIAALAGSRFRPSAARAIDE